MHTHTHTYTRYEVMMVVRIVSTLVLFSLLKNLSTHTLRPPLDPFLLQLLHTPGILPSLNLHRLV